MSDALVKVYMPTYRRPLLLERAIRSVIAQTFQDWVAEIHNDDPNDEYPTKLMRELDDPRIIVCHHETNWGALETFNFFYKPTSETFMAMLEDDNKWEPKFLETMIARMREHPEATLAWCNQHVDVEQEDGTIMPSGCLVRKEGELKAGLYHFGQARQAFGALHANGAMLLRNHPEIEYLTAPGVPFTGVEPYRERLFPGPMLYVPEPLARFTQTVGSARNNDDRSWAAFQTGLLSSFLRYSPSWRDQELIGIARALTPSCIGLYIQAALSDRACRRLFRHIRPREVIRWIATAVRHPGRISSSLTYKQSDWWETLDAITKQQFERNGGLLIKGAREEADGSRFSPTQR